MRRIGVLSFGDENDPLRKSFVSAFTQALADLGWTGDDINRMRALAQEMVGLQPDIIVANGTVATVPLQRETRMIPIVFVNAADPVAGGIDVESSSQGSGARRRGRLRRGRSSRATACAASAC